MSAVCGSIKRRKKLSEAEKWGVVAFSNSYRDVETKRFPYGTQEEVLKLFSIGKTTLQDTLREYDEKFAECPQCVDLAPQYKGHVGVPSLLTEEVTENIIDLHHLCLMEEDQVSDAEFTLLYNENFGTTFAKSTLQSYMHKLGIVVRSIYLKPTLTLAQKLGRLHFALDLVEHRGHGIYKFIDLKYEVHIDEKWFYVVRLKRKVRLRPEDDLPKAITAQHKSHIPKVMFLSAIGVPQDVLLPDGTTHHFDGKIGIFCFGNYTPAKRRSKNRAAGALVYNDIPVTSQSYLEMLTKPDGVVAKIKEKMFWAKDCAVRIRHDGAKAHTGNGNEAQINVLGHQDGWGIAMHRQIAQSPDTNKNDLCFFASLQKDANKIKKLKKDIPSLIAAVEQAYNEYPCSTLVRVHALQYEIYRQILSCGGGNDYPLPHSGIRQRQNHGEEVADLAVPQTLYQEALGHIAALSALQEAN